MPRSRRVSAWLLDLKANEDRSVVRELGSLALNTLQVLRTSRKNRLAYGQGQKTINVFLKLYVDWSSRPTADAAARIRPWLHCPLDKFVMEELRSHDTETWRERIWNPHYRGRVEHPQRGSLASVNEPSYRAWQSWIRELSPAQPVLIDAI